MKISVPYGTASIEADLPDSLDVRVIDPAGCKPAESVESLLKKALDAPIGTDRLENMATKDDQITIIVNDHTRPGPDRLIVAEVVRRLETAGVPDSHIKFVVATGSHRAPTDEELDHILGAEIHRRMDVHIHDCKDKSHLTYMGKTISGLPLWVNTTVADASFIVTVGLIAPHAAAGFSGGRKSIVPGVAGLETLKIHHSLPIRPFEPSMGKLEGNRFHEAALEAARKVNVRFIVNAVQDPHKNNIAFVAGDLEQAHAAGVEICRRANTVEFDELADLVIVSPGGAPRDCNLYQAEKALAVAEVLVKPKRGAMILCASAPEGVGEGLFQKWMQEARRPEDVIERFRAEGFNVGNNKAFMYARALTKGRVIIVSDHVGREMLQSMMLEWAPDLESAVAMVRETVDVKRVFVLPRAVNIIPHCATQV